MDSRKHFLDWLRVFAFAMLILFHVGLLYASWDYNIKSERLYPDLDLVLTLIDPWRLTLLFFIAGVASRFLLAKLGAARFTLDRLRRLLVVLLVGILLINPLQVYVELLHKGFISPGYLDFWLNAYLPGDPFPGRELPTWDHLWFLLYLLVYSLALAAVYPLVRTTQPSASLLLVVPGLWLCLTNVLIEELSPVTMGFVDDWANHLRWSGVFIAGVLFAGNDAAWVLLAKLRRNLLAMSSVGLLLHLGNALYWRTGAMDPFWDGYLYALIKGLYGWLAVLTLVAWAAALLKRSSPVLRYLTEAMLPVYVLHQPIMLAAAVLLFPLVLPVAIEALLLVLITGGGAFAVYELCVRRWPVMRFLSGLRPVHVRPELALRYE